MSTQEASPNQKIADRIKKLLALAKGNTTEAEASSAMEKVQELLSQYNLSMAEVESHGNKAKAEEGGNRQKDSHEKSAMYEYQQKLMRAVAETHFCLYWVGEKSRWTGKTWAKTKYHVLVGREANVVTAKMMFDYLNSTIEQLAKALYPHPLNLSKSAISWKEGCAYRLQQRLRDRQHEADEAQKAQAQQPTATTEEPTTCTSLMLLTDLRKQEDDLNYDLAFNLEPGTTALRRAQALAKIDEPKEEEVISEKERAKREKQNKKWWDRFNKQQEKKYANKDMDAFNQGFVKGADIGLDTQIS